VKRFYEGDPMQRNAGPLSFCGLLLAFATVGGTLTFAGAAEIANGGSAQQQSALTLQPQIPAGNLTGQVSAAALPSSPVDSSYASPMSLNVLPPLDAPDADAWSDYPSRWWLKTTPQVWISGVGGHVGVKKSSFSKNVSVDASFSDLTKHLQGGVGLNIEAGNGPFFGGFQGLYLQWKDDGISGSRGVASVDAKADFALLNGYFGYHFIDIPLSSGNAFPTLGLDGLLGTDWTSLSMKLNPKRLDTVKRNVSWFDPYVGLRGKLYLTQQIDIQALGAIGGFDADNDKLFWTASAFVEYRFTPKWSVFAGYQAVSQDYEGDNFVYKIIMSGPVVGLGARW
jgi:hypothetical protein